MKKLFVASFILLSTLIFSNRLSAQNPIPSFSVPVIADPTIFEEMGETKYVNMKQFGLSTSIQKQPFNTGDKKILVKVDRRDLRELQWATVIIYSLDGLTTFGPYTVLEGTVCETVVDERSWGVRVINASSNAFLSVWIE